ncbi:tRNA (adenosine(37)-N6)-threonylcarbamoyltransferase complex dimerization subunit type 1 TsaB [Effusibacillus consociatus]|uniref:tRNA (Adenosine(37)-N6)-threonylcarbamoyltransferase complex dimerization subunit type 1 TsaB n=1 Tax=Effusibacillus consociatus TaxID=1117041 RepID=A0ABV9PZ19_9BACL
MPYLAVDTATQTLTIAIGERNRLLAEASVVVKKNHSNRLMPLIESLFESLDLTPDELQGIVIGHGPGSYTGVRIGVTTGKLMAWSLKIPLVGVSSLDGLAGHYQDSDFLVCPMFDARRKQAYCALYDGAAKIEPDALRKLDDLFPLIEKRLKERGTDSSLQQVMFLGDGAENYRDLIVERLGGQAVFSADRSKQLVRAAYLLEKGIVRIEAGETAEVERFAPEYLQLVEAEAKLLGMRNPASGCTDGA